MSKGYTAEVANAMKTVAERLTVVEHKVAENARGIEGLREAVVELGARMDRGFAAVDRRLESMEQRFDRRFETMDRRFETMEQETVPPVPLADRHARGDHADGPQHFERRTARLKNG